MAQGRDALGRFTSNVEIDVVANDRTGSTFKRVEKKLKDLAGHMQSAARTMAKAGAMVASFSSLLGPLALGLAKVITVTAKTAVSLAPLVAFLPALAGGFALIKLTIMGMGPAMGAALKPIAEGFKRAQEHAGVLGAQGLPRLAQEFNRLNLPTISRGMDSIAKSTNSSVQTFGRWVNSASGVKLIGDVTDGASRAFAKMAPAVTRAALALLNMTNRAGVADRLSALGGVVAGLADKFTKWANSITSGDITDALDKMKSAGGVLAEKLRMVKDVVTWLGDNSDKVKKLSDALAGIGIALGLATGGWIAVVVGAVTLISNHWTRLKPMFASAVEWARNAWNAIANDPNVQRIGAAIASIGRAIRDDLVNAWTAVKPALDGFGSAMGRAWDAAGPLIAGVLENPEVRNGLRIMAVGLVVVTAALLAMVAAASAWTVAITAALAGFAAWLLGAWAKSVVKVIDVVMGAFQAFVGGLGGLLSHIPGLENVGRALQEQAAAFGEVRDRAMDHINTLMGIPSEVGTDVTLNKDAATLTLEAYRENLGAIPPGVGTVLTADGAAAITGVNRYLGFLGDVPSTVDTQMRVDKSGATSNVAAYKGFLNTTPSWVSTLFKVDRNAATAGTSAYKGVLRTVPGGVDTTFRVDRGAATSGASSYRQLLNAVPNRVSTTFNVNAGQALGAIGAVESRLNRVNGRVVNAYVRTTYETLNVTSNNGVKLARAGGGILPGAPSSRDNMIIGAASGEYVVNAQQTSRNLATLEAINSGRYRGYATGGYIAMSRGAVSRAGLGVTLNIYGPIGSQSQLEDWLRSAVINLQRKGRL